ncbi:hypothetical protein DL546_007805 [Coniochaeta pulveracea]|uniref:Uncharacterized protein n=1 Tax=Coniochaeta pulveracea TaxID=177199 RepID=A0A420YEE9_9PEZI|nr:hypothetical protein DL546_007805 [Coniochaeta pulveracea]
MSSRPASPSTVTDSQDLHVDWFDVVGTQGAYLVPRAGTPVFQEAYDAEFVVLLKRHLNSLLLGQECRHVIYHGAADEWPMGHTPSELKEKRDAELKAWDEIAGVTSDDDSDEDKDDEYKEKCRNDIDTGVSLGRSTATPERPPRPRSPCQEDLPPTPPLSAGSPLPTPQRAERRRVFKENEEEKQPAAKKHVSLAQQVSATAGDALPSVARQKGRKRGRNIDKADEEFEDRDQERPKRVRVTTTRPSSTRLQSLRPRPRRPAG